MSRRPLFLPALVPVAALAGVALLAAWAGATVAAAGPGMTLSALRHPTALLAGAGTAALGLALSARLAAALRR